MAGRAGVSVSLLYADAELAGRIATARDRQRQAGSDRAWQLPARSLITSTAFEQSQRKDQSRRLTQEVTLLRERLARQLGAEADLAPGQAIVPVLDQLEQRTAELEAENHRQREHIVRLQADGRRLVVEVELLAALPSLRPRIGRVTMRKVDKLACVRIGSARYSVPVRLIGRRVEVLAAEGRVKVVEGDEIVADHALVAPGEASIHDDPLRRRPAR